MPLLATGLWFLAIILTLPFLVVTVHPQSLLAMTTEQPTPDERWRTLALTAGVGSFLALCGAYIWTHP